MCLRISKFKGETEKEITETNVIWTGLVMGSPDCIKKQQYCLWPYCKVRKSFHERWQQNYVLKEEGTLSGEVMVGKSFSSRVSSFCNKGTQFSVWSWKENQTAFEGAYTANCYFPYTFYSWIWTQKSRLSHTVH